MRNKSPSPDNMYGEILKLMENDQLNETGELVSFHFHSSS